MKDNLKIVKATEGKESSTEATANETVNPPKQTLEERKAEKASCNREIAAVLEKYGCQLTAQMIITPTQAIPQVFLIDARN